jgi:hypothetical protein
MKIKPSSVSIDIKYLSCEVEAWYYFLLHGVWVDFTCIHTTCGYFSPFEPFGVRDA